MASCADVFVMSVILQAGNQSCLPTWQGHAPHSTEALAQKLARLNSIGIPFHHQAAVKYGLELAYGVLMLLLWCPFWIRRCGHTQMHTSLHNKLA